MKQRSMRRERRLWNANKSDKGLYVIYDLSNVVTSVVVNGPGLFVAGLSHSYHGCCDGFHGVDGC